MIVSMDDDNSVIRWNAETGEGIGDSIKVAGWPKNLVISNNSTTIACGSKYFDFVKQ